MPWPRPLEPRPLVLYPPSKLQLSQPLANRSAAPERRSLNYIRAICLATLRLLILWPWLQRTARSSFASGLTKGYCHHTVMAHVRISTIVDRLVEELDHGQVTLTLA